MLDLFKLNQSELLINRPRISNDQSHSLVNYWEFLRQENFEMNHFE